MYKVILACKGVSPELGPAAAADISEEFAHRQWHRNVRCEWDQTLLLLHAENDWDADAKALIDEFSDAISACIPGTFGYSIGVVSIAETKLPKSDFQGL
jgi:hypothetical protein